MRQPRLLAFSLLATAALSACGSAAATTDLLVVTPDPHVTPQPVTDPKFGTCKPVLPATATKSDVVLEGPCAFQFLGTAKCVEKSDDFYANVQFQLEGGGTANLNINIEKYKGPGTYTKASQIFFQTVRTGDIAMWLDNNGTATLSGDKKMVSVKPDAVPPAPGSAAGGVETVRGVLACG